MPVETKHKEYTANLDVWEKCEIAVAGERAVKKAGIAILPLLSDQDSQEYDAYKMRASYYNASGRTLGGLVGIVFRKPPEVIGFPESRKGFLDRVGKENISFESFARETFSDILSKGRQGVLLDNKETTSDVAPYLVSYGPKSIINWKSEEVEGEWKLSMVVLTEIAEEPDSADPFTTVVKERIRVLQLLPLWKINQLLKLPEEAMESPEEETLEEAERRRKEEHERLEKRYYLVSLYEKAPNGQKGADKSEYILKRHIEVSIRGKYLDYIPFQFFGPDTPTAKVQSPVLEDLIDVNFSHYRSSADLEHGRHFTALPTAFVTGFPKETRLKIGSAIAWVSEQTGADAKYLEYTGQGLSAIERALEQKEAQMAILGARILEAPKKAVEAAETLERRQAAETSALASVAASVESGFSQILRWVAQWYGITPEKALGIECIFNKDYMPRMLDPQMLTALVMLVQTNKMSWRTFAHNLKKGELYPEDMTIEEELQLILEGDPLPMGTPSGSGMELEKDEEEIDDDEEEEEEEEKE